MRQQDQCLLSVLYNMWTEKTGLEYQILYLLSFAPLPHGKVLPALQQADSRFRRRLRRRVQDGNLFGCALRENAVFGNDVHGDASAGSGPTDRAGP